MENAKLNAFEILMHTSKIVIQRHHYCAHKFNNPTNQSQSHLSPNNNNNNLYYYEALIRWKVRVSIV